MSRKSVVSKSRKMQLSISALALAAGLSAERPALAQLYQDSSTFDIDPGWIGSLNTTGTSNFGYSAGTSNAGGNPGEIGGTIGRNIPVPYYAVDVGNDGDTVSLNMNDALSFSGQFIQVSGNSGTQIGFFNDPTTSDNSQGGDPADFLGILVGKTSTHLIYAQGDNSNAGLRDRATLSPTLPFDTVHDFSFTFDPVALTITVVVDGNSVSESVANLNDGTESFNRFGIFGVPVTGATNADVIYYDNLSWTSTVPQLTWNNSGATSPADGKTWDTTNNNWNNGTGATTYSDGAQLTFNDTNNGNYAVTLNTTVSPGLMAVNNGSGNYTISGSGGIVDAGALVKAGSGTLSVGTSLSAASLRISAGTMQLATNTTLGSGAGTSNVTFGSLSITGNGVLDIGNNHIIINYGSGVDPIGSIQSLILSGFNASGTPWTGTGITSTFAKNNSGSYGIGYADSADPGNPAGLASGTIEIMYTLLGDANLDGAVNGSDFALLATNFNKAVSGWDEGDFNYDGAANGTDFALLAGNFNKGASQSAIDAGDAAALDAFASANGLSLANVPEPASVGALMLGAVGMVGRRRRRKDA